MGMRAEYDPPAFPVRGWDAGSERLLQQETSRRFNDLGDRAMLVSYHKYGAVADGYPERVNALDSLLLRLKFYREGDPERGIEPGNAEYLVDIRNFAMIEFMHPSIPARLVHTDADGSPGRIATNTSIYEGRPNQYRNTDLADAKEELI